MPSRDAIKAKAVHRSQILQLIFSSEAYSDQEKELIRRRRIEGISDGEWAKVQQYARLPDLARIEINKLIAFYWNWRIDEWIPSSIQEKVKKVRLETLKLMDSLAELSCDDNFYKGVFLEYKRSPTAYERELTSARDQLSKLDNILVDAQYRLIDGVSRATYKVAYSAVRGLDAVCHSCGTQLSTSKKKLCGINFVLEVFALIDVQIAPGSVQHFLKD